MTRSPGGFCRWGSFLPAHSFALSFLRKRTSELLITVLLAHKFCRRTIFRRDASGSSIFDRASATSPSWAESPPFVISSRGIEY